MGSAQLGYVFLLWFARKATDTKAVVIAMFVHNIIGFVVSLQTVFAGQINSLGWSAVGIFLVMALGYLYFLFKK